MDTPDQDDPIALDQDLIPSRISRKAVFRISGQVLAYLIILKSFDQIILKSSTRTETKKMFSSLFGNSFLKV
jgi:hypothetical protein